MSKGLLRLVRQSGLQRALCRGLIVVGDVETVSSEAQRRYHSSILAAAGRLAWETPRTLGSFTVSRHLHGSYPTRQADEAKPEATADKPKGNGNAGNGKEAAGSQGSAALSDADLLKKKDEEIAAKDKAIKEGQDRLLRSYADLENMRDRMMREAESTRKYAVQEFAVSMLEVVDNLQRAMTVIPSPQYFSEAEEAGSRKGSKGNGAGGKEPRELLKSLYNGVMMIERELGKVFKKHGVEQYQPTEGDKFDPNLHFAVINICRPDASKEPDTVAVVTKVGFTLNGRVIRPAEVGVYGESLKHESA